MTQRPLRQVVIVVRWNVEFASETHAARQARRVRLEDAWHEERMRLALRYTFPSIDRAAVFAASEYTVRAVIVCDRALKEQQISLVKALAWDRAQTYRVITDWPTFASGYGDGPVLWIRLDSDDVLGPDLIPRMAEAVPAATAQGLRLINPGFGLAYDEDADAAYEWRHPFPAVYGLIQKEGGAPPQSPHLLGHSTALAIGAHTLDANLGPLYAVTLHKGIGRNLCNRLNAPWIGRRLPREAADGLLP